MEENRKWHAKWIWGEDRLRPAADCSQETYYFRRAFQVPETDCKLIVDVSADSRYRLFFNGESVSVGPCKGDGKTHYYETIDLSDRLKPGKNVLAAKIVHYRDSNPYVFGDGPVSVWRANAGGFLLEGELRSAKDDQVIELLHTDGLWKCDKDESTAIRHGAFTFFVGGVEIVDGSKVPHGWEKIGYDDESWSPAVAFADTADLLTGQLSPWQLTKRPIPPLFERLTDFSSVVRSEGGPDRISAAEPILLEPRSRFSMELDAGELTTGYLTLRLAGGTGSRIKILCSECYEQPTENMELRNKGVRDRHEGNVLLGEYDEYTVAGIGEASGVSEIYEPFWFRTFRYVRIEVETENEPLKICGASYRDTGYPLEVKTSFTCSDEGMKPLWDISITTLQRCMHETYEDCPFYEQLQYIMDTRLQILFTYYISGDDRLARRAIHDFHSSMLPSGMLQSRYPSVYQQVIPGFSLYWILMLRDHYMFHGDAAFIRRYRPTIDAVMDWFDRQLTPEGIVGACPDAYWSYVDWVEEWKETLGMPTAGLKGPLTVYSLMYATALQAAADINEWTGRQENGGEYRERSESIKRAVREHCWSEEAGLFRDGPQAEQFSEHAQVWSVLSGTVTGDEAIMLMNAMLSDERQLPKVSYAMSFFMFRALSQVGMYDRTFKLWEQWRHQAEVLQLTTWLEDPVSQRSDCHAWGAIPLYEFPAEILGIKPGAPGFRSIIVEPQPGVLEWAKGSAVTPYGLVRVEWQREANEFRIHVDGPEQLPLEIRLPDGSNVVRPSAAKACARCNWETIKKSSS